MATLPSWLDSGAWFGIACVFLNNARLIYQENGAADLNGIIPLWAGNILDWRPLLNTKTTIKIARALNPVLVR